MKNAEEKRKKSPGDIYNRRHISPDVYQCGCFWSREEGWGDVLNLCPIHKQHSDDRYEKYREREAMV
jgi:hypothetical protein